MFETEEVMADNVVRILFLVLLHFVIFPTETISEENNCDNILDKSIESLCNSCNGSSTHENRPRRDFCNEEGSRRIFSRCCMGADCAIGIDWTRCGRSVLSGVRSTKGLNYLFVDEDEPCIGGDDSWSHVEYSNGVKICSDVNPCTNVTCPDNSHCVVVNGSDYNCLCDKDWHGYKCMRYKTFPAIQWLISIGATTFVLVSVLWSHQKFSIKMNQRLDNQMNHGTN